MRLFPLLLLAVIAGAGEASPLGRRADGGLRLGGIELAPLHCDARVRESRRASAGDSSETDGVWRLDGPWKLADGSTVHVRQEIRPDGGGLRAAWSGAGGSFGFSGWLPGASFRSRTLLIDGAALPLDGAGQPDLFAGQARDLRLPLDDGRVAELHGDLFLQVLDHRDWGADRFELRILAPAGGDGIAVRIIPADTPIATAAQATAETVGEPLPLGAAAATPRCDDAAGDQLGGWTDQGANDLSCLASGPLTAAGVRFAIADGAAVLARSKVAGRPDRAVVEAGGRHAPALYLLHTMAWAPRGETAVGSVRVVFTDGAAHLAEVRSGRMLADWWNPSERLPEAVLGWSAWNGQAQVGLYVARIDIPDRPIARIELALAADAVWAVAGLSLGPAIALRAAPPEIVMPSARWLPTSAPLAVAAGSALDLSALTPAPLAGPVAVRDAHLVAGDGTRLRLQGVNLCDAANFPSHAEADALVAAVRAMGCNALRFHHHDGGLALAAGDGTSLDPEHLDRLEYLIAAAGRAGLAHTSDIYVSRVPPTGAIPEVAKRMRLKALIPVLPSAMENWKRFATAWLTHVNPYTGRTLAADPGLLSLSLVNEDNLGRYVLDDPATAPLYQQRFAAWLAGRGGETPQGAARESAFAAFLLQVQGEAHAAMAAHLRSLGVSAPVTSLNWRQSWWSMAARQGFDLVDNHSYHDHPRFPRQDWRLPMGLRQDSATASLLRDTTAIAITRRFGRPFTVSEIQFCPPNGNRAEYAAAVPAVAGTQDWDGVWRFTLSGPVAGLLAEGPIASFGIAHDPIALLSERAVALLWRRGDIAPAPWSAALVVDRARAGSVSPDDAPGPMLGDLALLARIGNLDPPEARAAQAGDDLGLRCLLEHYAAGEVPAGRLPTPRANGALPASLATAGVLGGDVWDAATGRIARADGAVALDARSGILTVAGRRGCAAVLPGGASASVAGVAIANTDAQPATIVVAALGDDDLASARRLLILHLTDAQNTGARFASARRTLLESWGRAPVLVRDGACRITLPGPAARMHALDLAGVRRESLPAAGALELRVARAWGPCLAWEIER